MKRNLNAIAAWALCCALAPLAWSADPVVVINANETYTGGHLSFADQTIVDGVNVFVRGGSNSTLNLSDSTVSSNTLTNGANNGGAFISATNVNLDGVNMYGNVVSADTGSNYGLVGGTALSIANSEYIGNSIIDTRPAFNFAYGLVSHLSGNTKTLEVRQSLFSDNYVRSSHSAGGVFSLLAGASANIYSSTFSGNKAEGVDVEGYNVYSVTGSAIRVADTATRLYVQDSVFENNVTTANSQGGEYGVYGAICNYDATMTFKDCVFTANSAQNQTGIYGGGGAIYHSGGVLTIEATKDAVFAGNYVSDLSGQKLDEKGGFLYMDYPGAANINVAEGAALVIGNGAVGCDSIANESGVEGIVVNKQGAGTWIVNSSMEYFTASLNVNEGVMTVNNKLGAGAISVAQGAALGIEVSGQNMLTNVSLALDNAGTIILTAKAGLAAGSYTVSAAQDVDFGAVKMYGGDFAGNVFTVAQVETMQIDTAGAPVVVENNGRVSLATESGDAQVEMAFNSDAAAVNAVSTATDSLAEAVGEDFKTAEAYAFDVDMQEGDTVHLSFLVNDASLSVSDFNIYHMDESGSWSLADDVLNVKYDGEYLSFIVSHFSGYGYTAIPESASSAAVLGMLALAAAYRRRR